MIFSFDLRRAKKGDCFLLHFGDDDDPGLAIVDGGPKGVYQPSLKPRLLEIRKNRKLDDNQSLMVDLVMVSHVDDDHIQGLLELTEEEIERDGRNAPLLLNVQAFWHNSFDGLLETKPEEVMASVKSQFGEASATGGGLGESEAAEVEDLYADGQAEDDPDLEPVEASLKVLASIEQGYGLRLDAEKLEYRTNPQFGGKLVIARPGATPKPIEQGLKFTVVGPMEQEIKALQKKHDDWLEELKAKGKSPPQALAAYVDKSIPNLSSIVVLAELGGKKMLLTGDARGDKIIAGLEMLGLLTKDKPLKVDLLKVPHHGSSANLETSFFKRVVAKHYVFSGDGEHGNPEREAFEMLFRARGKEPLTIHLTYPVDEIDRGREDDWIKEQSKEKNRAKKKPSTKIRPDWSPKQHGLKAFFDDLPLGPGQTIAIVPEDGRHVIDLIGALKY